MKLLPFLILIIAIGGLIITQASVTTHARLYLHDGHFEFAGPPINEAHTPTTAVTIFEKNRVVIVMQVVISLVALGASLFVVLSKRYKPTEKHWAFGLIGTVIGFWLKM